MYKLFTNRSCFKVIYTVNGIRKFNFNILPTVFESQKCLWFYLLFDKLFIEIYNFERNKLYLPISAMLSTSPCIDELK